MSAVLLGGCEQPAEEHGFSIRSVQVRTGYQKISAAFRQQLSLSAAAVEALENGVPLTLELELELRNSDTLSLLAAETRRFEIRFLPLHRRYQLSTRPEGRMQTFPRLRHVLGDMSELSLDVATGPLAEGQYELRTRIQLDTARLPAPMHLPAFFSSEWRHDSEWSTWLFEVRA
jgi:hypothetical protein